MVFEHETRRTKYLNSHYFNWAFSYFA